MPSKDRHMRHLHNLLSSKGSSKSNQNKSVKAHKAPQLNQVNKAIGDKMKGMAITASPFNLLTSLPPELLIKVIAHLSPFYAIFFLNQSCRQIRQFIKAHAAAICNTTLRLHLARKLNLLNTRSVDGWLVPVHPDILKLEAQHEAAARIAFSVPKNWNFPARISEPGPQFLFVLPFLCWTTTRIDGKENIRDNVEIRLKYKVYCLMNGLDEWYTHPTDPKPRRWALTWYFGAPKDDDETLV